MGYEVDLNWNVECINEKVAELLQKKIDNYKGNNWHIKNLKVEDGTIVLDEYCFKWHDGSAFIEMLNFIKNFVCAGSEVIVRGEDSDRWGYWFTKNKVCELVFPDPERTYHIVGEAADETIDMIEKEMIDEVSK